MAAAAHVDDSAPHIPVLLRPLLAAIAPVKGTWLDGTFGAGGYTRALLEAGADRVIAVDRDPLAFEMAAAWAGGCGDRLILQPGVFSSLDTYASDLDGVVLDLGVSSMQLDQANRGFSFLKDGPLDMRMSQDGPSAADLVNTAESAITTTLQLADIVEGVLPRAKPGQSHPATRSFQALRIAVNAEYDELFHGLMASERALKPGGQLAVVTFHSIEDRMVKRFFQARSGQAGRANRYAPDAPATQPQFSVTSRKAIGPDDRELAENPRSRSAKLRVGRRTDAPSGTIDAKAISMPMLEGDR